MADTIVDRIYTWVREHNGGAPFPLPEKFAKQGIEQVIAALEPLGITLLYGGAGGREKVKVEPGSFFCPHCGKHLPPYGVAIQTAEIPGMGPVATLTIFCGVESCRKVLNVVMAALPPQKSQVVS